MRLYAQTPGRRSRQIVADLVAVVVIAAAVKFALAVHHAIMLLAEPGRKAQSAGDTLASGLGDAGDAASKVPFVGDSLRKPLRSAAEAGTGLSDAGQSLQSTVGHVATLTTVALIVFSVVLVLLLWLPRACSGSGAAPPPAVCSTPPAAPTCSPCASWPDRSARCPRCLFRPADSPTPGVVGTRTSSLTCRRSRSGGRVCEADGTEVNAHAASAARLPDFSAAWEVKLNSPVGCCCCVSPEL